METPPPIKVNSLYSLTLETPTKVRSLTYRYTNPQGYLASLKEILKLQDYYTEEYGVVHTHTLTHNLKTYTFTITHK